MGQGISEVLTFAVGVAISPVPIIAVILMLFSAGASERAAFLLGWVLALAVVSGIVYVVADQSDAATSSTASDTISWGKIVFGVLLLLLAARHWRSGRRRAPSPRCRSGWRASTRLAREGVRTRPAAGRPEPEEPAPDGRRCGRARATRPLDDRRRRLADRLRRRRQPHDRRASRLLPARRRHAKAELDSLKGWLAVHNAAVMTVLFLVFGVDLIAKGVPPLSG